MGSCSTEPLNEAKKYYFSVKALFFEPKTFRTSLEETVKKDFTVAKPFEIPDLG